MKRDFYESPKPNKVTKFLWYAAGADELILGKCTYSDQVKYSCLGGIVLSTGVMAALAGGYAFYTIFGTRGDALDDTLNIPACFLSIFFGCIWGAIIFNIDRFIVTSTGTGDGTEKITWDEIKGAIPRIIMGMILAITISKPIEIRMFKTEINLALKMEQDSIKQVRIDERISMWKKKTAEIDKSLGAISTQLDTLEKQSLKLQNEYVYETTRPDRRGIGDIAKGIQSQMERIDLKINNLKSNPDYLQAQLQKKDMQSKLLKETDEAENEVKQLDGLLERIKLAHKTAGFWISLFITLMFMAIELTPIFFKLMLIKSPYDFVSENIKELVKAENGIEIKHNYYQDKEGAEKDLIIQHNVLQKNILLNAQKELSEYAVQKWMEKQKQKIDENPDDFINNNENNKMS
jgi:hypothetical protein